MPDVGVTVIQAKCLPARAVDHASREADLAATPEQLAHLRR